MKWLAAFFLLGAMACSSGTTASGPKPSSVSQLQSPTASAFPAASSTPGAQAGDISGTPSPSPGPTPSTGPSPSPSPSTPTQSTFAVLVDLFAGGSSYNIALVGADGRVIARAPGTKRSYIADAIELPYVNASEIARLLSRRRSERSATSRRTARRAWRHPCRAAPSSMPPSQSPRTTLGSPWRCSTTRSARLRSRCTWRT